MKQTPTVWMPRALDIIPLAYVIVCQDAQLVLDRCVDILVPYHLSDISSFHPTDIFSFVLGNNYVWLIGQLISFELLSQLNWQLLLFTKRKLYELYNLSVDTPQSLFSVMGWKLCIRLTPRGAATCNMSAADSVWRWCFLFDAGHC